MDRLPLAQLSERELELMERRCAAASPGPWSSFVVGRDTEAGLSYIELGCCAALELLGGTVSDQDFIANAREDVPRLIDEVRRLRAEMKLRAELLAIGAATSQGANAVQSTGCGESLVLEHHGA